MHAAGFMIGRGQQFCQFVDNSFCRQAGRGCPAAGPDPAAADSRRQSDVWHFRQLFCQLSLYIDALVSGLIAGDVVELQCRCAGQKAKEPAHSLEDPLHVAVGQEPCMEA